MLLVPGLRRFPLASAVVLRAWLRAHRLRRGAQDALVIDSPYLADLFDLDARRAEGNSRLIYYAIDPYQFYSWDTQQVGQLEARVLAASDLVLSNASLSAEEFRSRTSAPVQLIPSAVSRAFADQVARAAQAPNPPSDLDGMARPLVGCVGKINATYDWDLIEALATNLPGASFVFVGPLLESDPVSRRRIDDVLALPNVHAIGARSRRDLPAYLATFDVCLSPLVINAWNDRRSPLRLAEYMTTAAPILTTGVHEASLVDGHATVVRSAAEAPAALAAIVASPRQVDRAARRAWLAQNTWEARATQVAALLESLPPPR